MDTPETAAEDAPLFDGLYQLAYVVKDFDGFLARLGALGVADFQVEREIVRPGGSGTIRNSAKAWAGPVMLEVIDPWRDRKSIYDAPIPDGRGAFLHHLGCDVADDARWSAVKGTVERQAWPVVSAGTVPGVLSYNYIDSTGPLGLMLEHVQLYDSRFYAGVPHNQGAFAGLFSFGFVTSDLEAAKADFARIGRIERFTDAAPGEGMRRRALARLGEQVLELIEPDPAVASSYREQLPASGNGARLHHLGIAAAAPAGLATTEAPPLAGARVVLTDTRADLGHLLAFVDGAEAVRKALA